MGDVRHITEVLALTTEGLGELEETVKAALFHPDDGRRLLARRSLRRRYNGLIKKGFVGDNLIMVVVKERYQPPQIAYLGAPPAVYGEWRAVPHAFEL